MLNRIVAISTDAYEGECGCEECEVEWTGLTDEDPRGGAESETGAELEPEPIGLVLTEVQHHAGDLQLTGRRNVLTNRPHCLLQTLPCQVR